MLKFLKSLFFPKIDDGLQKTLDELSKFGGTMKVGDRGGLWLEFDTPEGEAAYYRYLLSKRGNRL